MKQPFAQWFKKQADRQDAIGELARKYKFRGGTIYALTDSIEAEASLRGIGCVKEITTAYQALEEWERYCRV